MQLESRNTNVFSFPYILFKHVNNFFNFFCFSVIALQICFLRFLIFGVDSHRITDSIQANYSSVTRTTAGRLN